MGGALGSMENVPLKSCLTKRLPMSQVLTAEPLLTVGAAPGVGSIQNLQSAVHSPTMPCRSWWFGPGLAIFSIISCIISFEGMPGVLSGCAAAGVVGFVAGAPGLVIGLVESCANAGARHIADIAAAANSDRVVIPTSP